MKVYQVVHIYEYEDRVFDDFPTFTNQSEEILYTFARKKDAIRFVARYYRPFLFRGWHDEYWAGSLVIREIEVVLHEEFDLNKQVFIPKERYFH